MTESHRAMKKLSKRWQDGADFQTYRIAAEIDGFDALYDEAEKWVHDDGSQVTRANVVDLSSSATLGHLKTITEKEGTLVTSGVLRTLKHNRDQSNNRKQAITKFLTNLRLEARSIVLYRPDEDKTLIMAAFLFEHDQLPVLDPIRGRNDNLTNEFQKSTLLNRVFLPVPVARTIEQVVLSREPNLMLVDQSVVLTRGTLEKQ